MALLVGAALLAASTAWAQGGNYGGGVLGPGSQPITLSGTSGGGRPAQTMGSGCVGMIAQTPDHIFNITQQMQVRFEVIRAAGDTTLVVAGPAGVMCDDDSGGDQNPRIVRTVPPGLYQVWVGSYTAGQLHPYAIRVRQDVQRTAINVSAPVRGLFGPALPVDTSGRPFIDYTVQITQPGQYLFDLVSSNASFYDPVLELRQGGRLLSRDDDGGGYPNSRITIALNAGTYVLRATSFSPGQMTANVAFTLTITQPAPTPTPQPAPPPGIPGARIVVPGVPVTGTFRPWLPFEQGTGRPYMDFALTVPVQGTYQLDLVSQNPSAYDPYLRLMMVNGTEIVSDDDSGGSLNSRIVRQLGPGLYRIRVSCYNAGSVGAPTGFNLSVTRR